MPLSLFVGVLEMKKRIAFVLLLFFMTALLSCASKQSIVMKLDNRTPARLIWGDRIYDDCGAAVEDRSIGEQIGTIEGISDSRVFRVTGKPEQDSLIVSRTDEMTTYDLYRRETSSGKQGKS